TTAQSYCDIHLSQNHFTLSRRDALPIFSLCGCSFGTHFGKARREDDRRLASAVSEPPQSIGHVLGGKGDDGRIGRFRKVFDGGIDRKSTRLNSSHVKISYAVICLKKKII